MLRPLALATTLLAAASCSPATSPDAPASSSPSAVSVTPAAPATSAPTAAAATTAAPAVTAPASAAPVASAAEPAPAASASAAPATEAPLPKVKVANIGIHIGGGPNDDATKEPFRKSVQPHYDEMRRCWGAMPDGQKGDISVELRVDKDGGKARVRPNQTTFKNKDFNACVQGVFEKIDFLKPRTGTTVLNFSIRFTPG